MSAKINSHNGYGMERSCRQDPSITVTYDNDENQAPTHGPDWVQGEFRLLVANNKSSNCRGLLALVVKQIDLSQIAFGADTTLGYAEKARRAGGAAEVTDVTHTAAIALLGNHIPSTLVTRADGHGGRLVTVAPLPGQLLTDPRA
jgi:hypothetical protein